ncbi:MAG: helix-turn-helix domain-containing protein [Deltaproteobacteria bacterium]|nr:helix-turn-helix domain-containing protein [Deltaproteobacteria bacterium]
MDKTQKLLSVDDAAAALGLKAVTLRQWAAARRISRVKLGRRVLIPESEVTRLIEANLVPALLER